MVDTLRLASAELVLSSEGRARAVGRAGSAGPGRVRFVLRHRGEEVGELRVGLRPGEHSLDDRDRALLAALADQAAPTVAALRLQDQLQASREALVASREEERRRLRRDLHDGVGAALAGARLQLESAQAMVGQGPAGGMLEAASHAVAEAVADVRRLTDDLRPPALDELGLVGSLEVLAERVRTPGRRVSSDLHPVPPLPAALEVACYRIAAEALNNAARHARASALAVRLTADERELVLEVADDGQGLVPRQRRGDRPGLGLSSMQQRAEELGGRLVVETGPAGTTVRALLPRDPG